ncbi:MAG: cell division FtsA domain-containing protein [Butyricicoccus pullicaecorum]|nr:rod shape-determining protein [Butyricicoccus pullicaecorum]MDO4668986.1 cell division FtsA domain-containing protein [Butyricicoccus pullicaecorum]
MTENRELIFALDIGTRSVIGVVGYAEKNGLHVLAVERQDHGTRAMVDGQIQDISLVSGAAMAVKERLEKKVGQPLHSVCVAAAGRSLKTQRADYEIILPDVQTLDRELIARLETGAINRAEQAFDENGEESDRLYYLVGYSVTGYELDHYPMTTLLDHRGKQIKASVIATFLPSEVVESLCTSMRKAGLEVASLTLEPIAAMNLIIPPQLRLLNLALVDIGAGTSDIAVSQGGSVVGYTMATVAGDEITETLMKQYLLDFDTAEQVKLAISSGEQVTFQDILGIEHSISADEAEKATEESARVLCQEICAGVRALNGGAPSALFLVGGGSQLTKLREYVEQEMQMEPSRVAVGSANLRKLVWTDEEVCDLTSPDLATPLGIALSAAQQLTGNGLHILLNGKRANLFRSERLSIRDVLMMNGYRYRDFIGRTGQSVAFTLNGERRVIRGTQSSPAELTRNGEAAALSDHVHAGDNICFTPAISGVDANPILCDVLPELSAETVWLAEQQVPIGLVAQINGQFVPRDTPLVSGDEVDTLRLNTIDDLLAAYGAEGMPVMRNGMPCRGEEILAPEDRIIYGETAKWDRAIMQAGQDNESQPVQEREVQQPAVMQEAKQQEQTIDRQADILSVVLNDRPLELPVTRERPVYYLMDLLEHTEIDFQNLNQEVCLEINGQEASFQQRLRSGDYVRIYERPRITEF